MIAKHVPLRSGRTSSFGGLARYISASLGKGERLGEIRFTNLRDVEMDSAIARVVATQRANSRTKADRTYHMLLSFPAGETPSPEILAEIEERMCKALGFGEHQRISAVHHDTDNSHVHVAINKIHPTRHTIHTPRRDFKTMADTAALLEIELGLTTTNHDAQRSVGEGRAQDMARARGLEPLLDYVKRTCPDLASAPSWDAMHRDLAEHGLAIKLQGAGLAIVEASGQGVKASTISRGLSKAKLEAKLGAFAPPGQLPGASQTYAKAPITGRVDTKDLYARYEADRARHKDERTAAFKAARETRASTAADARGRSSRNQTLIGGLVPGRNIKRVARSLQTIALKQDLAQATATHARAVAAIKASIPAPQGWLEWLQQEALAGDAKALAALRDRATRRAPTTPAPGLGSDPGMAEPASAAPDSVTKTGTIIYRMGEATVRDDGDRLYVSRGVQDAGIVAALKVARDRHNGVLTVAGDDAFVRQVAQLAALHDPSIRFADENVERQRAAFARTIEEKINGRETKAPVGRDGGDDGRSERTAAGVGRAASSRPAARDASERAQRPIPADRYGIRRDRPLWRVAHDAVRDMGARPAQLRTGTDGQRYDATPRLRLQDVPRGGLADGQEKLDMLLHDDAGPDMVDGRAAAHPVLHREGSDRSVETSPGVGDREHGRSGGAGLTSQSVTPEHRQVPTPATAPAPTAQRPTDQALAVSKMARIPYTAMAPDRRFAGMIEIDNQAVVLISSMNRIMELPVSREVAEILETLKPGDPVDSILPAVARTTPTRSTTLPVRPRGRR